MFNLKNYLLLSILFFITACGGDSYRGERLPPDAVILAFGDSITYGYNANREQSYPAHLTTLSGRTVVNAGVSGERAEEARHRIDLELDRHQPQLVIIELGGNDFLARRSEALVKEDLRAIIRAVKGRDIEVALVAVPILTPAAVIVGRASDASLYKELAKEEGILLIPNHLSKILSDEELRSDQIHSNAKGYRLLAEAIDRALREANLL